MWERIIADTSSHAANGVVTRESGILALHELRNGARI
jgi:hypothetical protein